MADDEQYVAAHALNGQRLTISFAKKANYQALGLRGFFEYRDLGYTAATGVSSATRDATYKYGPYLKRVELPKNPFNSLTSIVCDIAEDDITVAANSGTGALFCM